MIDSLLGNDKKAPCCSKNQGQQQQPQQQQQQSKPFDCISGTKSGSFSSSGSNPRPVCSMCPNPRRDCKNSNKQNFL